MMGLTFKENCPDLRNSKVADVIKELKKYGAKVDVYDPWVDADEAMHEYGIAPDPQAAEGHVRCDRPRRRPQASSKRWASTRSARFAQEAARAVRHQVSCSTADEVDGRL